MVRIPAQKKDPFSFNVQLFSINLNNCWLDLPLRWLIRFQFTIESVADFYNE